VVVADAAIVDMAMAMVGLAEVGPFDADIVEAEGLTWL
jgi:hypothetical protein